MNRESLSTSIPLPHFQSGDGMLTHFWWDLFSQWYDGLSENSGYGNASWKFPDTVELQSWKVNFKTEVYTRTADPQITMGWIKEVAIAKSIDEHLTSRSIVGGTDFPDCDKLDAMSASALKKASRQACALPKKSTCRRAACSEVRPILTRKTNCVHDLRVFPCNQSL